MNETKIYAINFEHPKEDKMFRRFLSKKEGRELLASSLKELVSKTFLLFPDEETQECRMELLSSIEKDFTKSTEKALNIIRSISDYCTFEMYPSGGKIDKVKKDAFSSLQDYLKVLAHHMLPVKIIEKQKDIMEKGLLLDPLTTSMKRYLSGAGPLPPNPFYNPKAKEAVSILSKKKEQSKSF